MGRRGEGLWLGREEEVERAQEERVGLRPLLPGIRRLIGLPPGWRRRQQRLRAAAAAIAGQQSRGPAGDAAKLKNDLFSD